MQNFLNKKRKLSSKGFTLIELIVVIAIIGILVLLAMPKFMDYTRDAKEAKTQHNARVVDDAVTEYLVGNDDKLPEGLTGVTPEDIQDAIDEGTIYDPAGPVVEVPEGSYVEVETLPGMPNVDGRPISNEEGDAYIIIDKPIRTGGGNEEGNVDMTVCYESTPEYSSEVLSTHTDAYEYETLDEYGNWLGSYYRDEYVDNIVYVTADYEYAINSDGTATILQYLASEKNVVVPGKINGHIVSKINSYEAYSGTFENASITAITLPCTLEEIAGNYVFGWDLTMDELALPENLKTIKSEMPMYYGGVFEGINVAKLIIPKSLTSIDQGFLGWGAGDSQIAFEVDTENSNYKTINEGLFTNDGKVVLYGTQATLDNLPDSVEIIGEGAFVDSAATSFAFPTSLREIGEGAFYKNQLGDIIIPEGVTRIGHYAFEKGTVSSVSLPDTLAHVGKGAFSENYITSINIPSSLTVIPPNFINNNELTTINIPDTITTIKKHAFACNLIQGVISIPNSVSSIETYALNSNPFDNIEIDNIEGSVSIEGGYFQRGTRNVSQKVGCSTDLEAVYPIYLR